MTPYDLWKEIVEEKNMALAIFAGAMSLGMRIIIAAASIKRAAWSRHGCRSLSLGLPDRRLRAHL